MKKPLLLLAIIVGFLITVPDTSFAKTPSLVVNDKVVQSDVIPQLVNGRLMVPLRVISETMGANVTWIKATDTVKVETGQTVLSLTLNKKMAYVRDNAIQLDVPPKLIQNRTFVPLRFIGENLNCDVSWNQSSYQAIVKEKVSYLPQPVNNSRSLTEINYEDNGGQNNITLKVQQGNNKITKLTNPDRLVIDLTDASLNVDEQANINSVLLSGVRFNQYSPTVVRIVLDLKQKVKYQVNQLADSLEISLTQDAGSSPVLPSTGQGSPSTNSPDQTQDDSIYSNKVINNNNIIVVDAGHGGSDVGAIGVSGRYEKDVTLDIALKLKGILEQRGFQVVTTRNTDTFVSLEGIADIANNSKPFAFVSIHANKAGNTTATGVETYTFYGTDHTFADLVQNAIISNTGQTNRGVKESGFYVIKYTQVPAILVETGFLSNPEEENFLFDSTNQANIAEAIADGLLQFKAKYGSLPKPTS